MPIKEKIEAGARAICNTYLNDTMASDLTEVQQFDYREEAEACIDAANNVSRPEEKIEAGAKAIWRSRMRLPPSEEFLCLTSVQQFDYREQAKACIDTANNVSVHNAFDIIEARKLIEKQLREEFECGLEEAMTRKLIENRIREEFESGLEEAVKSRIDDSRREREDDLEEGIEERLRKEFDYYEMRHREIFEEEISRKIDDELHYTRNDREELLVDEIEEELYRQFADGLQDRIDAELERLTAEIVP
jgi:hypothetical protein